MKIIKLHRKVGWEYAYDVTLPGNRDNRLSEGPEGSGRKGENNERSTKLITREMGVQI